jgi:hypothetical protein
LKDALHFGLQPARVRLPDFVACGPDWENKKAPDLTWINSPKATGVSPCLGCYIVVLHRLLWQASPVEFMGCHAPDFLVAGINRKEPP